MDCATPERWHSRATTSWWARDCCGCCAVAESGSVARIYWATIKFGCIACLKRFQIFRCVGECWRAAVRFIACLRLTRRSIDDASQGSSFFARGPTIARAAAHFAPSATSSIFQSHQTLDALPSFTRDHIQIWVNPRGHQRISRRPIQV